MHIRKVYPALTAQHTFSTLSIIQILTKRKAVKVFICLLFTQHVSVAVVTTFRVSLDKNTINILTTYTCVWGRCKITAKFIVVQRDKKSTWDTTEVIKEFLLYDILWYLSCVREFHRHWPLNTAGICKSLSFRWAVRTVRSGLILCHPKQTHSHGNVIFRAQGTPWTFYFWYQTQSEEPPFTDRKFISDREILSVLINAFRTMECVQTPNDHKSLASKGIK